VVAGFIRAERIALVLRHLPCMMAANICNATVLGIALWNSPDRIFAVLWAPSALNGRSKVIISELGLLSFEPSERADQMQSGKEVARGFFVACRTSSDALHLT
jgi:hypothetical protein